MTIRPGEDGAHHTYCRLCEAQCGVIAEVEEGRITKIKPDRDHPVSRGHICVKAPGMLAVTYDKDRILEPLRRAGAPGVFEEVSWDEALDDIASRLKELVARHGGTSVASYIGNPAAFSTMHYAYGFGFIRMFGSDKVYNAAQVDTGARSLASQQVFGVNRFPFPDIPDTDFLVMFGANPFISHMSLICSPRAREHLDAIARRDGVVVVDPRRTETAKRYEHQPINPDGDVWLLVGMLRSMQEERSFDLSYIDRHVNGWEELQREIKSIDWRLICDSCGVSKAGIRQLAARFANAEAAACYGRVGTNRGRFSSLANILMDAINLGTGNFGRQGGSLFGESPFFMPRATVRASDHGKQRSRIGNIPIVGSQPGGGLADEILTPGEGQIRALFLDSGNPVLSYPDGEKTSEAFDSLELFVSLDFYMNESNRFADYILPVPTFYERPDANDLWAANAPEPWVHYVDAVIHPLGNSRHEYEIYDAVLSRMDLPDPVSFMTEQEMPEDGSRRSYLELADTALRLGPFGDRFGDNPEGLTFEKLLSEHPSGKATTARMNPDHSWRCIGHDDGKANVWTDLVRDEFMRLKTGHTELEPGQLRLFGRRMLHTMNSWMHNSDKVIRNATPTLLVHPDDAQQRQIADGQCVRVKSKNGEIEVRVEISGDVVPGSVNYPHGFGHKGNWTKANEMEGANVNLLASSNPRDWEPVSGNCHLDGIPVFVRPV